MHAGGMNGWPRKSYGCLCSPCHVDCVGSDGLGRLMLILISSRGRSLSQCLSKLNVGSISLRMVTILFFTMFTAYSARLAR